MESNAGKSNESDAATTTENEGAVTMLDVLKDEEELEEDANAVLGAADDQNCTYTDGYLPRQPLYACTTCTQPNNPDFKPAGICLACSYQCHEGCQLVELYTKRQFRCDCPTERFSSDHKCKFKAKREAVNSENRYNQNFSGLYCTCSRPYPDPEDDTVDEMIQCVICEDWYHGRHLGLPDGGVPQDTEYGEMICINCVTKYPILMKYKNTIIPENSTEEQKDRNKCKFELSKDETENCDNDGEHADTSDNSAEKDEEKSNTKCESLFLAEGWRSVQCRCEKCVEYYKKNNISFLYDEKDTVHFYESKGKKRAGQFEQGMEALSQMERVQQVEAISMYNNMKCGLMDYLKNFARQGKVVTEEDIRKFFSDMKSAKRPRLDLPPPDTCK